MEQVHLQLVLRRGGRFVLSDDSHGPHAVGLNYDRLADYLRRMGIEELWFLQYSATPNPLGRPVSAFRVEGDWWKDSFWSGEHPAV